MTGGQMLGVRVGLCILLCALAAWGIFATTFRASMLLAVGPTAAERFWPGSAEVLAQRAEQRLAGDDAAGAAAEARRALGTVPVKIAALRTLGLAEQAQGDLAAGLRWIILSGKWGWRDTPTQVWLLNWTLAQGDYASAMQYADGLLRREVANGDIYLLLLPVIEDPRARAAFVARLEDQPPWRGPFFAGIRLIDPARVHAMTALLADLARGATPPTRIEAAPYLWSMTRQGDYQGARALWARLFDPQGKASAVPVDGDFSNAALRALTPDETTPFDWQLGMPGGGVASIEQSDDPARGLALYAQYDGVSAGDLARTVVVLRPGAYRLSALMRSDQSEAGEDMIWSLTCSGTSYEIAATSSRSMPTGQWIPTAIDFVVPQAGCAEQDLRLRGLAGSRSHDVSAWFDDVVILQSQPSSNVAGGDYSVTHRPRLANGGVAR